MTDNWQFSLGIIKPHAVATGASTFITDMIHSAGLTIVFKNEMIISDDCARHLYENETESESYVDMISEITSGLAYIFIVAGNDSIDRLAAVAGPADPAAAKEEAPKTIRAIYGDSSIQNGLHVSTSSSVSREIRVFFPDFRQTIPTRDEMTQYITDSKISDVLTEGLVELARAVPADPVKWFGEWMCKYNERVQTVVEPEE